MPAANLVAVVATAIFLASAQTSTAGITVGPAPDSGTPPLGCAGHLPSPLGWSCPPFVPAPAMGREAHGQGAGISLGAMGGAGKHAGKSGEGWSRAIPAPPCSTDACIPELMGAPPATTGGVPFGTLSPLLLGCLTLLGALGIRPRA